MYQDIEILKKSGFIGGVSVAKLKNDNSNVPNVPGVYVITKTLECGPSFLTVGTGGHFKGKNPNVELTELQSNWVDDTIVIYIGKATSLRKRLRQYMQFGSGKDIGHWGGRFIWQLSYAEQLLVWWKPVEDPELTESDMIQNFKQEYGVRPFANLRD